MMRREQKKVALRINPKDEDYGIEAPQALLVPRVDC